MTIKKKRAIEILQRKRKKYQARVDDKTIHKTPKQLENLFETIQALDLAIKLIKRGK